MDIEEMDERELDDLIDSLPGDQLLDVELELIRLRARRSRGSECVLTAFRKIAEWMGLGYDHMLRRAARERGMTLLPDPDARGRGRLKFILEIEVDKSKLDRAVSFIRKRIRADEGRDRTPRFRLVDESEF